MRYRRFVVMPLLIATATYCCGQKAGISGLGNIFLKIDPEYIHVQSRTQPSGPKVYMPYYEFNLKSLKTGEGCVFAVSKKHPDKWTNDITSKQCSGKSSSFASIVCRGKELLSTDTSYLITNFDIYFFFVDKKDLDDPIVEEAEGGTVYSYYPKPGGKISIYQYRGSSWILIDKKEVTGSDSPRVFGARYMQKFFPSKMKSK
jgi:hypothetical protein